MTQSSLYESSIVWDCHTCLPLLTSVRFEQLLPHKAAGVTFTSINVGMDFNPVSDIHAFIEHFQHEISASPEHFLFVNEFADIERAKTEHKLAISFDLEGSVMLEDDPTNIEKFAKLGVRQIHLAYNRNNSIAGGCHDTPMGLTPLGIDIVAEINKHGMLMDCSHMGEQSTFDVMEHSIAPVIFSHSNPKTLSNHQRCITDEQIKACAQTGGVIGLSGLNRFIGVRHPTAEDMVRQVEYIANMVGLEHVGIGLDTMYPSDISDGPEGLDGNYWWPPSGGYRQKDNPVEVFNPSGLVTVCELMQQQGYSDTEIKNVLGGNFLRVAKQVWQSYR